MIIVQVGTNTGNDDVSNILNNQQPDLLILIEPMNVHNEKIESHYSWVKNKIIKNIAISLDDNQKTISFFYHINDGPLYEVASLNPYHILKHGYSPHGLVELKVECKTINSVFEEYNLKNIDILFIDAEGLDDEIIKTIDFSKYNIKNLYFENLHIKNVDVYNYLISKNYEIIEKTGNNGWSSLATKNN